MTFVVTVKNMYETTIFFAYVHQKKRFSVDSDNYLINELDLL